MRESTPATNDAIQPLMDAAQVAAILGVDPSTVHRFARDGRLGYVSVGRKRKFTRRHVQAYLDDNSRDAKPVQVPARPGGRRQRIV